MGYKWKRQQRRRVRKKRLKKLELLRPNFSFILVLFFPCFLFSVFSIDVPLQKTASSRAAGSSPRVLQWPAGVASPPRASGCVEFAPQWVRHWGRVAARPPRPLASVTWAWTRSRVSWMRASWQRPAGRSDWSRMGWPGIRPRFGGDDGYRGGGGGGWCCCCCSGTMSRQSASDGPGGVPFPVLVP